MLELASHLPEVNLAAGDVLIREGTRTGSIWVMIAGSLRVMADGVQVNSITQPGALVGEVAVLLERDHSATVEAVTDTKLRYAADGHALLSSDPEITKFVAVGLAERLSLVTTYLSDLTNQYADVPGISMVSDVLRGLSNRTGPAATSGSAREPDPEY